MGSKGVPAAVSAGFQSLTEVLEQLLEAKDKFADKLEKHDMRFEALGSINTKMETLAKENKKLAADVRRLMDASGIQEKENANLRISFSPSNVVSLP